MATCGIKHDLGDQTCLREHGHDGLCLSKWEACLRTNDQIVRAEWHSKNGVFASHHAYKRILLSDLFKEAIAEALIDVDFGSASPQATLEAITNGVIDYLSSLRVHRGG